MSDQYGPHRCVIWAPKGYRMVTWEHTNWNDEAGTLLIRKPQGKAV